MQQKSDFPSFRTEDISTNSESLSSSFSMPEIKLLSSAPNEAESSVGSCWLCDVLQFTVAEITAKIEM